MTEPKVVRADLVGRSMEPVASGDWVLYRDYEALTARVEELDKHFEEDGVRYNLMDWQAKLQIELGLQGVKVQDLKAENKRLREAIVDKHCSCIWGTTDPDNRPYREEICWRCDTLEDLGIDPEREKL